MVRGTNSCDAIDGDCSTPCGSGTDDDSADWGGNADWGGGDSDMDATCVAELLGCIFDSECAEIVSACDDGCDHSLEPLRENGCCSNDACHNLHDCVVDTGLVGDDETCAEYNFGPILVVLLVVLSLGIAAITGCSYFCCCRKQPQHQHVTVQQPQSQVVVMATPVGQPSQFNVTVPPGVQPGQSFQVQSPTSGMMLLVQVPASCQAGMSFTVQG
jgi:hypothetical protein